jgi:hypothetical protein
MKHYDKLSQLENICIDLEVFASAVRVMSFGAPEANPQDVENMIHHISTEIDKIKARLDHSFDGLFQAIKEEGLSDTSKKTNKKTKQNKV